MGDFYRSSETWTREMWAIPTPRRDGADASIAKFYKAVAAARDRYIEVFGGAPKHDDWLRMWAADDEIILFFERKGLAKGTNSTGHGATSDDDDDYDDRWPYTGSMEEDQG